MPSARDLLPGVVHWVDIVGAIDGQSALLVQVRPSWCLHTPGDYIFSVQVSAEDADAAVINVQVQWDGTWRSLSGEQVSRADNTRGEVGAKRLVKKGAQAFSRGFAWLAKGKSV